VRNNHISHCEQTGIVGSLGCAFSTVTGNEIHDIHVQRLFSGAEMAGIKFHGAIDVEISHNHIYRTPLGIWLDWMAQGSQVTANLLHDNEQDLILEVNHGPILVANNLFLSPKTQDTSSQGSAYAHNLIAGVLSMYPFDERLTPFHKAHATELAGLHNSPSGDVRYYNNLFVRLSDASPYNTAKLPVWMAGNVFLKGARPSRHELAPLLKPDFDPQLALVEKPDGWYLEFAVDRAWATERTRNLVTTGLLGKASVPNQSFENADGSPIRIDTDYFGKKRKAGNPFPGPFEFPATGRQTLKVWRATAPTWKQTDRTEK
jgi:alpha-N-arabinofuranosidase